MHCRPRAHSRIVRRAAPIAMTIGLSAAFAHPANNAFAAPGGRIEAPAPISLLARTPEGTEARPSSVTAAGVARDERARGARPEAQRTRPAESRNVVRFVQRSLNEHGFDAGPVDGVLGPRTESAMRAFARACNADVGGAVTERLLDALRRGDACLRTPRQVESAAMAVAARPTALPGRLANGASRSVNRSGGLWESALDAESPSPPAGAPTTTPATRGVEEGGTGGEPPSVLGEVRYIVLSVTGGILSRIGHFLRERAAD